MRKLRRHTAQGIEQVELWLDQVKRRESDSVPPSLLDDLRLVSDYEDSLEIDERMSFTTRFDWGVYIDGILHGEPTRKVLEDVGLWTWLTLVYFDQVCPADADGNRRVKNRANYVPSVSDFRTYYRHYLLGPWRVIRAHRDAPERARALLVNPLFKPGELAEQGTANQKIVTNPAVVEAMSELYLDRPAGKLKRGAGGSGPGSPRRLVEVLDQLSLTFDFQQIGPDSLLKLLPKEFKRFRSKTT